MNPPSAGDPPIFLFFAGLVLSAAAYLLATAVDDQQWQRTGLVALVVWGAFCAVSNALPVPATRNVYLSMSAPVNIAVAGIMPPPAAAAVVALTSVSQWEISRSTTLLHAVFNRAQLALAVAAAAAVMQLSDTGAEQVVAALGAVAVYYATNWLLVATAERLVRGTPMSRVLLRLLPSRSAGMLYLALGLVGVALAAVYDAVGAWAVALLLTPLLGARHAVRSAQDLERSERERALMATRLSNERERERVRIASEIHDVVLQRLAALQLQADTTVAAVARGDHDTSARCALAIREGTDEVIADLRQAISRLTRGPVSPDELVSALTRLAGSLTSASGLRIRIDHTARMTQLLNSNAANLLYEVSQEALTNVVRHAEAHSVEITIGVDPERARLVVRDDGIGLRPGAGGLGLQLMHNKLTLAGGSLSIDSTQGGTTLVAVTPTEC